MANLNGGYVMINLADTSNLYNLALKAIDANKPIMVYGDDIPYIADSVTADGSSVTITKGGQIITISDANAITKTGDKDGALLSSIVDDNGNKRFVEWELETEEITGVTFTYNKASLSGTHLMIVLAGDIADTTVHSFSAVATLTLPTYVAEKIIPIVGNTVDRKTLTAYDEELGTQTTTVTLALVNNNVLTIYISSLTLTADRSFRVQFDLLIDTE